MQNTRVSGRSGAERPVCGTICAFALTMPFTLLILLVMRRRLDRVDMVESIKSVG